MTNLRCPSKTFLIGEYSVLSGFPALVMGHSPFFECKTSEKRLEFPKGSPADRVLRYHKAIDLKFEIKDPHNKNGGFGRSTAEYLFAKSLTETMKRPEELLKDYQGDSLGYKPSGADLIAQYLGGLVLFDRKNKRFERITWPWINVKIDLIPTGRKENTHNHLKKIKVENQFSKLGKLSTQAIRLMKEKDFDGFKEVLNLFQNELCNQNLQSDYTTKIVDELMSLEGVFATKGCGALGVDVVLVLHNCSKNLKNKLEELSLKSFNIDLEKSENKKEWPVESMGIISPF